MSLQKSYFQRREVLQNWLSSATNSALREKCESALSLSDHAIQTFASLGDTLKEEEEAYTSYYDTIKESIDKRTKNYQMETDKLTKLLETETDEQSRDGIILQVKTLRISGIGIQSSIDLLKFDIQHRNVYWRSVDKMEEMLAKEIFAPNWKDFSMDAAMKVLEFIIGLTPAGPIVDASTKIGDLFTRNEKRHNTTDEHLNYLDDYCNSIIRWCAALENIRKRFHELINSYS